MSPIIIVLTVVLVILQITLPKKLGFMPILLAVFHLGNVEVVGDLTVIRLLIVVGLGKAIASNSFRFSFRNPFDRVVTLMCIWIIISSIGHPDSLTNPFIYRVGKTLNILGSYLYARAFLPDFSRETLIRYCFWITIIAIPFSGALWLEKTTHRNSYYMLGARTESAASREGKVRAKGTFGHAILAGTVGATTLPLAFFLYRRGSRKLGMGASIACIAIVIASASSGPLAALGVVMVGLYSWRWRQHTSFIIKLSLAAAVALQIVMSRNVWHLMSMMDLVGGSTGWHRARLMDRGLEYLGDWWLFGTDYTRHWMPTGVSWNPNHTDITNHYLALGVVAGLPALVGFIALIVKGVRATIATQNAMPEPTDESYASWCLFVSLMAHSVSMISIAYFDQSFVLFYTTIALINNARERAYAIEENLQPRSLSTHPSMSKVPSHS